jgi:DNA-binding HxlR family transcriptional regulator
MQLPILSPERAFDGQTYRPEQDFSRLTSQMQKVFDLMQDGSWRTIPEIVETIPNATPQSISARLRDLRKEKYGSHTVEREHVGRGLYAYRLVA